MNSDVFKIIIMKKILLTFFAFSLLYLSGYSQRILEWSIGDVEINCGMTTTICYPLQVSINDNSQNAELGTSTIRFFFDSELLSNWTIQNVENSYTLSGVSETVSPFFGPVFGMSGANGTFAAFDLVANTDNALGLETTPVHVLDLCFEVTGSFPLCSPIVFDNNHLGWGMGIAQDDGYLNNDAGMVGTYYLNQVYNDAILADDEVINVLWQENPAFIDPLDDVNDEVGMVVTTGCFEIELPDAMVAGGTVCSGDPPADFTFSGTPDAVVTYSLDGAPNTTITLDGSGNATLPASNTMSSTVTLVSVENITTNCSQLLSSSATVTVNPLPTASVAGTSSTGIVNDP